MLDGIKTSAKALPATGLSSGALAPAPAAERAPVSMPMSMPVSMPVSMEASVGAVVRDMAASPPVNAGKVEQLRAGIDSGTFAVDPGSIADAMIAKEGGPAAA